MSENRKELKASEERGVRFGRLRDVPEIVDIHLKAFPQFFLSFLGRRFLVALYEGILVDSSGLGFVCVNDDSRISGFVMGSMEPVGFYRRLLNRDWIRFASYAIGACCRRPAVTLRLLRALRKAAESRALGERTAELMSIAVDPKAQKNGIGEGLLRRFCDECSLQGIRIVKLTTDRIGNERVNRFYTRNGFRISRDFSTPEGRAMNEYMRILLD